MKGCDIMLGDAGVRKDHSVIYDRLLRFRTGSLRLTKPCLSSGQPNQGLLIFVSGVSLARDSSGPAVIELWDRSRIR